MPKKITKIFRVGKNTYFHHNYGVYVRKNKLHARFLGASSLASVVGLIFVFTNFALPFMKNSQLFQNTQELKPSPVVQAEPTPLDKLIKPIAQEDEGLKELIESKISTYPSSQKWSVLVYDLKYDRTVKVNENEVYASASLYKLFLIDALENKLPYDKWWWTWVGGSSVGECVEKMIKSEDSPCAEELGKYIGWEKVDEINKQNGYSNTTMSSYKGKLTTPADVSELFVRMKKGQVLSDKARRFVFDALYQQGQTGGFAKGCKDCRAADKIGELNGITHDAGVVTHGPHSYALVVMSKGGSLKQIAEITKLIDSQLKQ